MWCAKAAFFFFFRLIRALQRVVVEQLLDEIDVAHEHAAAAVPVKIQRVQSVALRVVRLEKIQVGVPLVPNHLVNDWDGQVRKEGGEWRRRETRLRGRAKKPWGET